MVEQSATAIICAVRPHGEAGGIVRVMTEEFGMLAGYVQGAKSRTLRPVLIPGNMVKAAWRTRVSSQLPSLVVELAHSRGHLLGEPLAAAAIDWCCALTAATVPEAHPYPRLHSVLDGLLQAIELAPAARGWAPTMARYEALLLAELGYGAGDAIAGDGTASALKAMATNREALIVHILGDRRADVIAARERLVDRLKRAVA
jgi:DNA repair protein RecO (recombination protein O)